MYHHKAPHRHWEPGPEHLTMYEGIDIPEPKTLFDDYRTRTEAAKSYTCTISDEIVAKDTKLIPPEHLNEEQMRKWNAAYEPRKAEFEKALTLNEKEKLKDVACDAKIERGEVLLAEGKYREAKTLFEEVLTEDSDNFRALLLLGRAFFKEGNWAKAVENLQKALELDPIFPQTYIELAAVAYEQGDLASAEKHLETAQKYSLPDAALATDLAIVYTRQGKFAEAEAKLKEAFAKDAGYARAHFAAGYLAENRGDLENAVREYEAARDGGFYDGSVSYKLASAYYLAGAKDKAREELYRCISLGFYPQDVLKFLARIECDAEN